MGCTRGRTRRGASTWATATGPTVTRTSLADRTRSTTTLATGMASTTTRAVPTSQVASRTRPIITTIRGNPTTTELPFPDSGTRPQRGPLDYFGKCGGDAPLVVVTWLLYVFSAIFCNSCCIY